MFGTDPIATVPLATIDLTLVAAALGPLLFGAGGAFVPGGFQGGVFTPGGSDGGVIG